MPWSIALITEAFQLPSWSLGLHGEASCHVKRQSTPALTNVHGGGNSSSHRQPRERACSQEMVLPEALLGSQMTITLLASEVQPYERP